MYLILTVQPVENEHYRFGMSQANQYQILHDLEGQNIFINLPGVEQSEVQSQTFFNYGNLINTTISDWIVMMGYDGYPEGSPTKLIFKLEDNIFTYYPYQAYWHLHI